MSKPRERRTGKVTVAMGAGVPRLFKNVGVEVDYQHGLVEVWDVDAPERHLATAPLGATLIEWETAAPVHYQIRVSPSPAERPIVSA